jgi:hypothetical protein
VIIDVGRHPRRIALQPEPVHCAHSCLL